MHVTEPLDVVIVGAGMTGLTAALMLARDGHRVTVLDRDPAPPPADAEAAWAQWQRPGVSQFRQPHLMLPRWFLQMRDELPELVEDLLTGGARQVNLLHMSAEDVTHGWQPGDEAFDTLAVRRPVLEAALGRLVSRQPRVHLRRGVRATGLVADVGEGIPHVLGVATTAGVVTGDLVVDAAGRRTPVPRWTMRLGGRAPVSVRAEAGFVYYSRHFRSVGGRLPDGTGPVLSHLPSLCALTLPGDLGMFCVVLAVHSQDRAFRDLRHEAAWSAVAAQVPAAAPWLGRGEAVTGVMPVAGITDVRRSYIDDEGPVVTGLVALGDAAASTDPVLGRGVTIGAAHCAVLRQGLASAPRGPRALVEQLAALTARDVTPWVDLSIAFSRHRLAELAADAVGMAYRTDDPAWAATTALMTAAGRDPVLARVSARLGALLSTPQRELADPETRRRLSPFVGGERYRSGPDRRTLVAAVSTRHDLGVLAPAAAVDRALADMRGQRS